GHGACIDDSDGARPRIFMTVTRGPHGSIVSAAPDAEPMLKAGATRAILREHRVSALRRNGAGQFLPRQARRAVVNPRKACGGAVRARVISPLYLLASSKKGMSAQEIHRMPK